MTPTSRPSGYMRARWAEYQEAASPTVSWSVGKGCGLTRPRVGGNTRLSLTSSWMGPLSTCRIGIGRLLARRIVRFLTLTWTVRLGERQCHLECTKPRWWSQRWTVLICGLIEQDLHTHPFIHYPLGLVMPNYLLRVPSHGQDFGWARD
jgi:hypothetical protein